MIGTNHGGRSERTTGAGHSDARENELLEHSRSASMTASKVWESQFSGAGQEDSHYRWTRFRGARQTDAVVAAEVGHSRTGFMLPKNANNLLFAVATLAHESPRSSGYGLSLSMDRITGSTSGGRQQLV